MLWSEERRARERSVQQSKATRTLPLLAGRLFLIGFFDRIKDSARALNIDLNFEDLIEQAADIGASLFGLGTQSFDKLGGGTYPLGRLGDGAFYFAEGFRVNNHASPLCAL